MTQPAIFISHAVADAKLATKFTLFLKEAIGVPEAEIFCSSVPGHGIPQGEDFNAYIKDQIQEPKLVILLMTPAYMESWFCLMELGAAWAKSAKTLPVVVPPTDFNAVNSTLGTKQAWRIDNHVGLIDLRDLVRKQVQPLEHRSDHTWEGKRAEWIAELPEIIANLNGPKNVEAAKFEDVSQRLASKVAEVEALQQMRRTDAERIARLETAKDATEVKAIKAEYDGGGDPAEQFEELIEAVRKSVPSEAARSVIHHIVMDHFGKHLKIDWYNERAEFENAINYNLLAGENRDYAVEWGKQKLKPLGRALDALQAFLKTEEGQAFAEEQAAEGVPMELDDLAFWEKHLKPRVRSLFTGRGRPAR